MTQRQAASLITAWAILLYGNFLNAQSLDDNQGPVEVSELDAPPQLPTEPPKVGRKAAGKYMGAKGSTATAESQRRRPASASSDHYLAVHMGSFISDNSYQWGTPSNQTNVGSWNIGVTYRMGEWHNSMDLGLRVDLQSLSLIHI